MANPQGTNFSVEPPYGARKQMDRLEKSSVLAGAQGSTAAIETPRRSKRRQTQARERQQKAALAGTVEALAPRDASGGVPATPGAPGAVELPYEVRVLAVWEEIAQDPDASPLAMRYLEAARREVDRAAA